MLWFTHFFMFFLGAFVAILFSVRNPTISAWVNKMYLKAREKALAKAKEAGEAASNYIKDKTGSIQVSPVSGGALAKYLLRFGIPLLAIVGLVALLKAEMLPAMLYKCCLIFIGFILAEFIWVVAYKRTFGKIEEEDKSEESRRSILIFRGILYGSIILGLTLGL